MTQQRSLVCSQCLRSRSLSLARALLQLLMRVLYCISFILLHTQVLFNMQRLSSASSVRSQFHAGYTQLRTCFQQWPTLFGGKPCTFCNYRRGVTSPRWSADRPYVAVGFEVMFASCKQSRPVVDVRFNGVLLSTKPQFYSNSLALFLEPVM